MNVVAFGGATQTCTFGVQVALNMCLEMSAVCNSFVKFFIM
jgi:hypothetical protein